MPRVAVSFYPEIEGFTDETIVKCENTWNVHTGMACGYAGRLESFDPNLASIQNATLCPRCGSANNEYNRAHCSWINERIRGL